MESTNKSDLPPLVSRLIQSLETEKGSDVAGYARAYVLWLLDEAPDAPKPRSFGVREKLAVSIQEQVNAVLDRDIERAEATSATMVSEDPVEAGAESPGRSPVAPSLPESIPISAGLLLAGGLLLIVGSLSPWVTILGFGIGGLSVRYGLIPLLAGIVALVAGFQFWRGGILQPGWNRKLAVVCGGLALLSLVTALFVGLAIKTSIAESRTDSAVESEQLFGLEEFEQSIADAFSPGVGFGIWITAFGGFAVIVGSLASFTDSPVRARRVLVPTAAIALLTVGLAAGFTMKANADQERELKAVRARAEAAERARQQAEAAAEAERERQREAEEADKQRFTAELTKCDSGEFGEHIATGTIRNDSSIERSYTIQVEFLDRRGRRIADSADYVFGLQSGETAKWEAQSFRDRISSCRLGRVEVAF